MKKRLFTMFMSIVLAAGSLQPMGVYATEEVIDASVEDTEENEEVIDPTVTDDTPSENNTENKTEKKKKKKETKKENTEVQQSETVQEEETVAEEPEVQAVTETVIVEPIVETVLPEEEAISEEEFDEIYGISWNAAGAVSDINRSALNSVILYEEGMTEVWMIKGQKIELPEDDWTFQTLEAKKYFSIKNNIGKAKKAATDVPIMSGGTHSKKLTVHIYEPKMQGGVITLGEGETKDIQFNYNREHFDAAWYSSNPNVVSVSGNMVTGINKGTATVDVYVGGQKFSKKVKVESVSKIKEFDTSIDLTVGQSVKVRFRDGFITKKSKWEVVSGNTTAEVGLSQTGILTGIKPGTTAIKAVDKNNKEMTLSVNVVVPEKELYLEPGKSKTIKFYKVKNSGEDKAVWTSADKNVADVSEKGKITAKDVSGNTVITCTYKGVEYRTRVYVEKPEFATDEFLDKINDQYLIDIEEGTDYTLVPVGVYRDIEYKSNAPSVAFVDEYGRLHAKKGGSSASITATIGKKKLSIKVMVRKSRNIEVPEKCVNVLDYGAVPYDGEPDEDAFNAAITAAAAAPELNYTVYVPEGYYNIDVNKRAVAIKLQSNVKLIMDPMAVLHVNATDKKEYSIISIKDSTNVLVQGGQVEGGRTRHEGPEDNISFDQEGFGVVVGTHADNVEVRDMLIYDNWADGIYIYSSDIQDPPDKIKIINCKLYNNRRNNISVIAADDLLIEDCVIKGANGTAPMAGIDIEPNPWTDENGNAYFKTDCTNIKIKNCILSTPDGRPHETQQVTNLGIYYSFMVLGGTKTVVSDKIEMDGCIFYGDVDTGDSSNLKFTNCTINGTLYYNENKIPVLKNTKAKNKESHSY